MEESIRQIYKNDCNNLIVSYKNYKYSISLIDCENYSNSVHAGLWFRLNKYFLVTWKGEWRNDTDESSIRTIFGAIVCSIQSFNLNLPILYIPSTIGKVELVKYGLGYHITPVKVQQISSFAIGHYETKLLDISTVKLKTNTLYYIDGVYQRFMNSIESSYPIQLLPSPYENKSLTIINIEETYDCNFSVDDDESITLFEQQVSKSTLQKLENLQKLVFFLRKAYLSIDRDQFFNNLSTNDIEAEIRHSISFKSILKGLEVTLKYHGNRSLFYIDNAMHTVLYPIKQNPCQWKAKLTIHLNSLITSPYNIHSYSGMLRSLMVNYILGKCAIDTASPIKHLFSFKKKITDIVSLEKAKAIASVLSDETIQLLSSTCRSLDEICRKAESDKDYDDHADFMRYLFIDSLEKLHDHKKRISFSSLLVELQSILSSLNFPVNLIVPHELNKELSNCNPGWWSILSLYVGTLQLGIWNTSTLWNLVCQTVRDCWDNNCILSHLESYQIKSSVIQEHHNTLDALSNTFRCEDITSLTNAFCFKSLWDDIMVNQSGDNLPNRDLSLVIQKLQLIQFCIDLKSSQNDFTYVEGSGIRLLRRIPLTNDHILQYNKIANKITDLHVSEEIINETNSCYLKNQLLYPCLVSDIKAFKAFKSNASFTDFYLFYGIESNLDAGSQKLKSIIEEVWPKCESCSADEQKPLFRIETEVEKCLSYFENMTSSQLYAELIISSLSSLYIMLSYDVYTIVLDVASKFPFDIESEDKTKIEVKNICYDVINQLNELCQSIFKATEELKLDIQGEEAELNIDQKALVILDSVEVKIRNLELFVHKYQCVSIYLQQSIGLFAQFDASFHDVYKLHGELDMNIIRLSLCLSVYGNVTAANVDEARILYNLSKFSSMSQDATGSEHDVDENEDIENLDPNRLLATKKVIHMSHPLLVREDGQVIDDSIPSHEISVSIGKGDLRLSTKFYELDFC